MSILSYKPGLVPEAATCKTDAAECLGSPGQGYAGILSSLNLVKYVASQENSKLLHPRERARWEMKSVPFQKQAAMQISGCICLFRLYAFKAAKRSIANMSTICLDSLRKETLPPWFWSRRRGSWDILFLFLCYYPSQGCLFVCLNFTRYLFAGF